MSVPKEGNLRIDWKYAADFKQIYATNSFGVAGEYDYRLVFGFTNVMLQNDPYNTMPKAEGEYKVEIAIPFRSLKELRNMLDEAIKAIEARMGEIKIPKRPEDYFKQP